MNDTENAVTAPRLALIKSARLVAPLVTPAEASCLLQLFGDGLVAKASEGKRREQILQAIEANAQECALYCHVPSLVAQVKAWGEEECAAMAISIGLFWADVQANKHLEIASYLRLEEREVVRSVAGATRVLLLNSAIMPTPGDYSLVSISQAQFLQEVRAADQAGTLVSAIGYPRTAEYISRKAHVRVPLTTEATVLQAGDVLLIMRRRSRTGHSWAKWHPVDPEDYEFFRARFCARLSS